MAFGRLSCECENESHFPGPLPGHRYGALALMVGRYRTEYGMFSVCEDCYHAGHMDLKPDRCDSWSKNYRGHFRCTLKRGHGRGHHYQDFDEGALN